MQILPEIPSSYSLEDTKKELLANPKLLLQEVRDSSGENYEKINSLIAAGGNINMQDENGWAPLSYAACHEGHEILELLIKHGADVGVLATSGSTPLHFAATKGTIKNITILISAGADINYQSDKVHYNDTPLMKAAGDICRQEHAVKLIELGADVNRTNREGYTALHYAVMSAISDKPSELIKLLLEKSADPFKKQREGWAPLHCAASNRRASLCALILGNLGLSEAVGKSNQIPSESLQKLIVANLLKDNVDYTTIIEEGGFTFESAKEMILGWVMNHKLSNTTISRECINFMRDQFIGEYYRKKLFNLAQKLVLMENNQGKTALQVMHIFSKKNDGNKEKTIALLTKVQNAQSYSELPEEVIVIAEEGIKKHVLGTTGFSHTC